MLVLARREGEKLVFPRLGITIELLGIKGATARLGIDAPNDVKVLRHELVDPRDLANHVQKAVQEAAGTPNLPHSIRNHLHAATLALSLYGKQMAVGRADEAAQTLEMAILELQSLEQKTHRRRELEAGANDLQRHRALVVEDDANQCELLAGFLRISGFDVATAGDGADALGYLSSHERPDVVLLDMYMPRCDGPKTVDAIRNNPQFEGMRLFAISGTSPASLGLPTGPAGIDRWFPKPLNPEVLVRELSREFSTEGSASAT